MAGADDFLWPSCPSSLQPADVIEWYGVQPSIMEGVRPVTIRRIGTPFLVELVNRHQHLFQALSAECQEAVMAKIQKRPENKIAAIEEESPKKVAKRKLQGLADEAEAAGDLNTRLRIIELEAKLEALLNVKPEASDPTIIINVHTGVPRAGA